jgi:hypothetical protein
MRTPIEQQLPSVVVIHQLSCGRVVRCYFDFFDLRKVLAETHRRRTWAGFGDLRSPGAGVAFMMATFLTIVPLQWRATLAALPSDPLAERSVDSLTSYCLVLNVALPKIRT